jgi:hypothetical protein
VGACVEDVAEGTSVVEALLGLVAAVDSLGDGEDDGVVGARATAEIAAEDPFG